jgi:hypothetical protein
MQWKDIIRQKTIDWLLGPEDPSVRFWALQQLDDRPADGVDVIEAQEAVMGSSCVKAIMKAQKSEGHWGTYGNAYTPKYKTTTHNLLILAELGAERTPKIEKAIEYLFLFQRNSGHFLMDMPKTEKGYASTVYDGCCYDGNILYYLIHFGYLDDPRTERLIDFQVNYHSDDVGGWKCRAYPIERNNVFPENCYMGGVKMLKALARIPKKQRSVDLNRIIKQEVEIVLENGVYRYLRNSDGSRKDKAGWKRFGFPLFYQSDVLEVLDTLTELEVMDERMQDSIDLVIGSQQSGRWLLKNTYNGKMLCEIEKKNQLSKWITLRAARVLKRYFG